MTRINDIKGSGGERKIGFAFIIREPKSLPVGGVPDTLSGI